MATKPSGLTLGGILLQQASTTREAERYKIHPAKPRAAGKKNEKGKGLEDSRSTHTKKCKQGDGGARRATTQPGAPGPVPSPKKFLQDGDGPRRAPPGLRPRGQQRRPGVQNSDGGSALRQAPAGACRGKKTVRSRQLARSKVNPGSPLGQPWVPNFWRASVGPRRKLGNGGSR